MGPPNGGVVFKVLLTDICQATQGERLQWSLQCLPAAACTLSHQHACILLGHRRLLVSDAAMPDEITPTDVRAWMDVQRIHDIHLHVQRLALGA